MKELAVCMLLAEPYDPDMPARPAIMEISSKLASAHHKVVWILPAEPGARVARERQHNGIRVYTVPCYSGSSPIGKLLAKLPLVIREIKLVKELLGRHGCDIVMVREDISGGLAALYLRWKYRIPFVFQYSFPFVNSVWEKHKNTRLAPLFRVISTGGNAALFYIMKRANMVFPVSDQMKRDLVTCGLAERKMITVPLGVNTTLFSPNGQGSSCSSVRQRYDLHGVPVVLYMGTLDRLRQPEMLVRILAHLKKLEPTTKLMVVGSGDGEHAMRQLARDYGLDKDIIFTGQVPYVLIPSFIAAANVGLSPIPPTGLYRSNSPSKMLEYMAMGKPVVANTGVYEHEVVLTRSGGGVLVPFTVEGFAAATADLLRKPERATEMGSRGREWVAAYRSYETIARHVEMVYHQLLEVNR